MYHACHCYWLVVLVVSLEDRFACYCCWLVVLVVSLKAEQLASLVVVVAVVVVVDRLRDRGYP